ncbi:hemerythrin domain-containing protein [Kitasatospora brasiliensis]|uniref:hemerythrin domain-containing protein n=1 Tax=Kitasatospora brasiliensis TaxID=3058040 RepID=UPI00292F2918|nr:hemerythrin domain-containing protein [Kitasatospora sp. K002]
MNGVEGFPNRLSAEHRAIEALLRQLTRTTTGVGDDSEALRLLGSLRRLLGPHLVVEETHLYPLARRRLTAGDALADAAGRSHATIRRLLDRAQDDRLYAGGRRHTVTVLAVLLRAHLRGEDERLFPALRARAAAEELRTCERRMREGWARQPGAPLWGLPPGTGAIAALRDHVSGHDTSGQQHSP